MTDDADRVQAFDLNGEALRTLPSRDAKDNPNPLRRPHGLARGPNGLLYVADTGNQRVAVFSPDGTLRSTFGREGSQPGAFNEPRGLAVADRRVWVADMCNHRLQAFDLDGQFLCTLGQHGDGPAQFQYPVGIGILGRRIFVSEYTGCRLQVLSLDGRLLQTVRSPDGRYLGALGVMGRTLSVSDSASRVHLFRIEHALGDDEGLTSAVGPATCPAAAAASMAAATMVATAHTAPRREISVGAASAEQATDLHQGAKMMAERQARMQLAAQAATMRGVLEVLTQDDVHWLLPAAYADAAIHPDMYSTL